MNDLVKEAHHLAPRQSYLKVANRRICIRSWGRPNQPLVLMLHGFQSHAALWDRLGPLVAARGYHVVAPDRRGHGLSDWYDSYTLFDYVTDLRTILGHFGDEAAVLVGHCESTFVVGMYAHAFPEEVSRLCLVQFPDLSRRVNSKTQAGLVRLFVRREGGLDRQQLPVFSDADAATEVLLRDAPFQIPPAMARVVTPRNVRAVDGGVGWCWDPRLLHYRLLVDTVDMDLIVDGVASLKMPVELIYGRQSSLITGRGEKLREFASRRIPRARYSLVPGGHYPHMEDTVSVELVEAIAP